MTRRTGVYVEGLRETVRSLERAGVEVDDLKDVMGAIAAKAAEIMRPLIPSRSGKLRGSARPNRAKGRALVTIGTARVKYAGAVNYGWGRAHANYKHGRHATGIRGSYRGADFTTKTDAQLEDTATRMLEAGLVDVLERNGL